METNNGQEIEYDLPYPKHEFLRFLEKQEAVMFHGSGDFDIEEFVPLRTSTELNDSSGRGNKLAIYATHDALWPLFFAIIDRPNLQGSIRNGVDYFQNEAGQQLAGYHFSINREQLADRPVRTGMLYILPRETFVRLEHAPGIYTNEWASTEPTKPIARLRVAPEDFPFLEQIAGHDDSALLEMMRLSHIVLGAVTSATVAGDSVVMTLAWDDSLAESAWPFVAAQRAVFPVAHFRFDFPAGGADPTLTISGPAAYMAVLKQNLSGKLVD